MTILTKLDKKPEKAILVAPSLEAGIHPEGRGLVMIRTRRTSSHITTLLLFLIALLVTCMGIIGGVMIYRQYASQKFNVMRFHGGCRIPYDTEMIDNDVMMAANQEFLADEDQMPWLKQLMNDLNQFAEQLISETQDISQNLESVDVDSKELNNTLPGKFLQEDVELDISADESFSKIMPKFVTGSDASFLHDFKAEQTGILDKSSGRCFIMPLDKEALLPPKNLADLIVKMRNGYYNINTEVLQKNMRVKIPAITDMSSVSPRIAAECKGLNIYELEKIISGVFKRSVNSPRSDSHFTEFGGKGFNQYTIVNIHELNTAEPKFD